MCRMTTLSNSPLYIVILFYLVSLQIFVTGLQCCDLLYLIYLMYPGIPILNFRSSANLVVPKRSSVANRVCRGANSQCSSEAAGGLAH